MLFASSQIALIGKLDTVMKQVGTTPNFHAFDVTHDAKIWQTSTIKISPVKSHKHIHVTSIVQNKLIGILYELKT